MKPDPDELRATVERWIRADYYLKRTYLAPTVDWMGELIQAEGDLCALITGERELVDAARVLGCRMMDEVPATKPVRRQRSKLEEGLW